MRMFTHVVLHPTTFLSITDWLGFLILDLGTPAIGSIPLGTRIIAGLYQGTSTRASGFSIVPLALLAPAVKQVRPFVTVVRY